jgi:hypothetical protein
VPSWFRDPGAPEPAPRKVGVTALIQRRGNSSESAGMRFVGRDELYRLPFWPAQLPIRDALLSGEPDPIVE